jgi:hypothetical protein
VLDFARRELAGMRAGSRDGWWAVFGDGIVAAAAYHPLLVLDLLEEFPPWPGLPFVVLRRIHVLIRADEDRTLRLLTAPDGRLSMRWRLLSRSSCKRLATSGRPEIELVGRAVLDNPAVFARLLRDLRPSARSAFYDAVTADQETSRAILAPVVLDALPHPRRHAEARRMLALSAVADRLDQRQAVVARLPWAEALPELRTAVRRADPEERAVAYPLLIKCAVASGRPAEVTELLTGELGRLRNEQDPVRRAALTTLAAVPPNLFEATEAVTDKLFRLVVDATEARDTSLATRNALRVLACRILARHAADEADPAGLGPGRLRATGRSDRQLPVGSSGSGPAPRPGVRGLPGPGAVDPARYRARRPPARARTCSVPRPPGLGDSRAAGQRGARDLERHELHLPAGDRAVAGRPGAPRRARRQSSGM